MNFPVSVEIRRSVFFLVLAAVVHLGAVACVVTLPLPFLLCVLLSLAVCVSAGLTLRPGTVVAIRLVSRDRLECRFAGDEHFLPVTVRAESTVYSHLVVLRLSVEKSSGRVLSVALFFDQMGPDDYRALRLWLRWQTAAKKGTTTIS